MDKKLFSLIVVIAFSAAGCAHQPLAKTPASASSPSSLERADALEKQGDYNDAAKLYGEVLKGDPGNRDALVGMGNVNLAVGNPEYALQDFRKVLSAHANDLDALEGSGLAELDLGQLDAAQAAMARVASLDQQSWRAMEALGIIEDIKGQYPRAMEWYEKALTTQDREPLIYNNYGYSRIMAHDYAQAEALLSYGLKLAPNDMRLRNNLVLAVAWQGQYDRALSLRGSIPLHVALNNIGYIAMQRQDYASAARLFQRAMDVSPTWYALAKTNLESAQRLQQSSANVVH